MFSLIAIKVLFLIFPGLVGVLFINKFSDSKNKYDFQFFYVKAFIIGFISYLIFYLFTRKSTMLTEFKLNDLKSISYSEIFWTTLISLAISLLYTYGKNHDWVFIGARKIKLTKKFQSPTVFQDLYLSFENKDLRDRYISLKFYKNDYFNNKFFVGKVYEYIISDSHLEVCLGDVSVHKILYPDTRLYEMPYIYLKLKYEDFFIEFLPKGDDLNESWR